MFTLGQMSEYSINAGYRLSLLLFVFSTMPSNQDTITNTERVGKDDQVKQLHLNYAIINSAVNSTSYSHA